MKRIFSLLFFASLGGIGCDTASDSTHNLVGTWSSETMISVSVNPVTGVADERTRIESRYTYTSDGQFIRLDVMEDSSSSGISWRTEAETGTYRTEVDTLIQVLNQGGSENQRVTDIHEIELDPIPAQHQEFVYSIEQDSLLLDLKVCVVNDCAWVPQIGLMRVE